MAKEVMFLHTKCPTCDSIDNGISGGRRDIGFAFRRYHYCNSCGSRFSSLEYKNSAEVVRPLPTKG